MRARLARTRAALRPHAALELADADVEVRGSDAFCYARRSAEGDLTLALSRGGAFGVLTLLAALAGGCADLLEIGDLSVADAGPDSPDGAGRPPTACSPGALVSPVSALALGPDGGPGPTCRIDGALDRDGVAAGLDYADTANSFSVAGTSVASCVAVRFEAALAAAILRLRAVGNACGVGCDTTACGTGQAAETFLGPDLDRLYRVDTLSITSDLGDYTLLTRPSDRVVVVCRTTHGVLRDDVEVDSVVGRCP